MQKTMAQTAYHEGYQQGFEQGKKSNSVCPVCGAVVGETNIQTEFCAETSCFYNSDAICTCTGDYRNPDKGRDCIYFSED